MSGTVGEGACFQRQVDISVRCKNRLCCSQGTECVSVLHPDTVANAGPGQIPKAQLQNRLDPSCSTVTSVTVGRAALRREAPLSPLPPKQARSHPLSV